MGRAKIDRDYGVETGTAEVAVWSGEVRVPFDCLGMVRYVLVMLVTNVPYKIRLSRIIWRILFDRQGKHGFLNRRW